MQQGRVLLDSDWNAQLEILSYRLNTEFADVIGPRGAPEACAGFGISPITGLLFDGSGAHGDVGTAALFAFAGRSPFTLEAQIELEDSGRGTVLSRWQPGAPEDSTTGGYRLYIDGERRAVLARWVRSPSGEGTSVEELVAKRPLEAGRRIHLAAVYDGKKSFLYIDGRRAAEAPATPGLAGEAPLWLGSSRTAKGQAADGLVGLLAEARIWNVARGASEIRSLQTSRPPASLLAEWFLNEGHGQVLQDYVGDHPAELVPAADEQLPRWVLLDLEIGPGRYYVDGVLGENPAKSLFTAQRDYPGAQLPEPGTDGEFSVYLDVWERTVTYLQAPEIREVALGGPDTTTRSQTLTQVKLSRVPTDAGDSDRQEPCGPRVRARRRDVGELGNLLYRVEVHFQGKAGSARDADGLESLSQATFKWSRQNGSVTYPIEPIEENSSSLQLRGTGAPQPPLQAGDWLEVVDDAYTLRQEALDLVQIKSFDPATLRVELVQAPPLGVGTEASLQPLVRLWNQQTTDEIRLRGGTVPIEVGRWIDLEAGIQVRFESGLYESGDYWMMPARTRTGDIEWPTTPDGEPEARGPVGVAHRCAPLAHLDLREDGVYVRDRRTTFPPATAPPLASALEIAVEDDQTGPGLAREIDEDLLRTQVEFAVQEALGRMLRPAAVEAARQAMEERSREEEIAESAPELSESIRRDVERIARDTARSSLAEALRDLESAERPADDEAAEAAREATVGAAREAAAEVAREAAAEAAVEAIREAVGTAREAAAESSREAAAEVSREVARRTVDESTDRWSGEIMAALDELVPQGACLLSESAAPPPGYRSTGLRVDASSHSSQLARFFRGKELFVHARGLADDERDEEAIDEEVEEAAEEEST